MPYSIKWGARDVYCKFTGEVTGQELFDCNMALYSNSEFDRVRFQIFDMLEATTFNYTPDDVIKVAAFDRAAAKIWPRMKCALVSTNRIAHELSKIYQDEIQSSSWVGKSFRTLDEALEWVSHP